jgi:membrane protein involved in colicin uptake
MKNLKSISEIIPLQEKLDEAKARAEKLAAYKKQVAEAARKALAAMEEKKEAARKAAEVEKQIIAAKKLADEAKAKAQAALKERAEAMIKMIKRAKVKATLVTKQAKNMSTIGDLLLTKTTWQETWTAYNMSTMTNSASSGGNYEKKTGDCKLADSWPSTYYTARLNG